MTSAKPAFAIRSLAARATALAAAIAIVASHVVVTPAQAQRRGGGPPIIRDAEIEQLLREYTQPILKAAGLAQQNIQVVIINDRALQRVRRRRPAHLRQCRRADGGGDAEPDDRRARARNRAHRRRPPLAPARAAAPGDDASRSSRCSSAPAPWSPPRAPAAPAPATPAWRRSRRRRRSSRIRCLAYVRSQEDAADRAGVRFLNATGQSAKGMYETFKRLADQILYAAQGADPYMQSHPHAGRARARAGRNGQGRARTGTRRIRRRCRRGTISRAPSFSASSIRRDGVARRYPISDNSLPARYARAIAAYRFGNLRGRASQQIDALIQAQPQNPYFHELKGQALLEAGKRRRGDRAAAARGAARAQPGADPDHAGAGACSRPTTRPSPTRRSRCWKRRSRREPESPEAYDQIAMAYGRKGDLARADLASAQAAFTRGDLKTARALAAPRQDRVSRSARRAGSRPTTSRATSPGPTRAIDLISSRKGHHR